MKKISLILIALCVSCLTYGQTFVLGGTTYEVVSGTNTVNVTGYNTAAGTIVNIPASVLYSPPGERGINYSVVGIGPFAFTSKGLTSLTLPEGLLTIGNTAFYDNSLTSVVIPNSVNTIEYNAFKNNQIASLDLGTGVEDLGLAAFSNNEITSITLPGSLQTMGNSVFLDNLIKRVTIKDGVGSIGVNAFQNNPVISVTSESVIPPSLSSFGFVNNNRDAIDLYIPDGATGAYVTNSGAEWTGFKSVAEASFVIDYITYEVTSTNPATVSAVNYNTLGGPVVTIPETITVAGTTYDVTKVGEDAFRDNGITSVSLANSIRVIDDWAFGFNQLTEVKLPDNIETVGIRAFSLNSISSIDFGASNAINVRSFSFSNNSLTSLVVPGNIANVGNNAFGDNLISTVTIEQGTQNFSISTFWANPLTEVICNSSTPATIFGNTSGDTFRLNANEANSRSSIDLIIPLGTMGVYVTDPGALWTGFKSVTESAVVGLSNSILTNSISIFVDDNDLKLVSSNEVFLTEYSILNMNGRVVKNSDVVNENINIASLLPGHYVLVLSSDKGEVVKRFLK